MTCRLLPVISGTVLSLGTPMILRFQWAPLKPLPTCAKLGSATVNAKTMVRTKVTRRFMAFSFESQTVTHRVGCRLKFLKDARDKQEIYRTGASAERCLLRPRTP